MHLDAFLTATATITPEQLGRFRQHIAKDWITEALLATGTATMRRRRLPAEQVIWLVLGMALMRDLPIVDVVDKLDLALPAAKPIVPSAVPQARTRLGAEPMQWLFMRCAEEWANKSADAHRWNGLAVYGVDGTTLRVPDSDENRRCFGGQSAGANGRGESGYPMVRLAALMVLRSHLIAAAAFGPYADERVYAQELWAALPDDSVTIVDRLYFGAATLYPIARDGTNRHWLTRKRAKTSYTVVEKLGRDDEIVELEIQAKARAGDANIPSKWRMRAITYRRPGHERQVLLTSMLDAKKYPASEVVALYHERWEIELGYDELKTEMLDREEAIRSKSPVAVEQELWGILLVYNLIRLEMALIAREAKVPPIRVSFVAALRYVRDLWYWHYGTRTPGRLPAQIRTTRQRLARFILPERRERSYPRAVKVKMSNYALNRRGPLN
jgi:hypothetical protein